MRFTIPIILNILQWSPLLVASFSSTPNKLSRPNNYAKKNNDHHHHHHHHHHRRHLLFSSDYRYDHTTNLLEEESVDFDGGANIVASVTTYFDDSPDDDGRRILAVGGFLGVIVAQIYVAQTLAERWAALAGVVGVILTSIVGGSADNNVSNNDAIIIESSSSTLASTSSSTSIVINKESMQQQLETTMPPSQITTIAKQEEDARIEIEEAKLKAVQIEEKAVALKKSLIMAGERRISMVELVSNIGEEVASPVSLTIVESSNFEDKSSLNIDNMKLEEAPFKAADVKTTTTTNLDENNIKLSKETGIIAVDESNNSLNDVNIIESLRDVAKVAAPIVIIVAIVTLASSVFFGDDAADDEGTTKDVRKSDPDGVPYVPYGLRDDIPEYSKPSIPPITTGDSKEGDISKAL